MATQEEIQIGRHLHDSIYPDSDFDRLPKQMQDRFEDAAYLLIETWEEARCQVETEWRLREGN